MPEITMGAWVVKSGMVFSGFLAHFSDIFFSEKYLLARLGLVAQAYTPKIARCMQEDSSLRFVLDAEANPVLKNKVSSSYKFLCCFYLISEIGKENKWGRNMWIGLSKWEKDVKILLSRINAQRKMASEEEASNNQVNRMVYMWTVSFFPSHSHHCPIGPVSKQP